MESTEKPGWIVLGREQDRITAVLLDPQAHETARVELTSVELAARVTEWEQSSEPRWVWHDTPTWYGPLLDAGVRVRRCHDLRLSHAIVRHARSVGDAAPLRDAREWDVPSSEPSTAPTAPALFVLDEGTEHRSGPPSDIDAALLEFRRQRDAVAGSTGPDRLRLLLAAESAGALVATEMRSAGLPWDAGAHDAILAAELGARPRPGHPPALLEAAADRVRAALGDPGASLDSQPKLLRSLHRAGVPAQSTSKWELSEYDHPVIAPLLEYKRLSRLHTANGWAWLDEWVRDGRFRPVYVPGGVVTGRWASSGGGALQLPRQLRRAVRADPGWRLVVADVAQLEPRVLAAMAGDTGLADAARGRDLYAGVVGNGVVSTRAEAKIAILGAMYGATTGDSGRLLPRLRSAYPRAMALVDDAARIGDEGGVVATWLGRTSPPPSAAWREVQARASDVSSSAGDETRARRSARDRGRFTRNFVVQGTAAEWALAWLADLRGRLAAMETADDAPSAPRSGPVFSRRAHLALFLHDEVIIHVPAAHAEEAAEAARESAATAARVMFGGFPIDFPLDVRISDSAEKD